MGSEMCIRDRGKDLPKEAREKIENIKTMIDKFKEKVIAKFDKYVLGIALAPPDQTPEGEVNREKVNTRNEQPRS